jgi:CCR4-NOT transcription complex subunit 9
MSTDIEQYVHQLINTKTREHSLLELSKKREAFPELAPFLWYSQGSIAALLQEIVSIYPLMSPPALTAQASNRVCNALALLQCVASHQETRSMFLQGEILRSTALRLDSDLASHLQRTSLSSCIRF